LLPAGITTFPLTTILLSSRAAKLFPALSVEETWSTVRTNKLVPSGMVTALAAKGVSKTQIRVRVKEWHILWEFGELILRAGELASNLRTKPKPSIHHIL
jgi:hypothetical protein